MRLYLQFLFVDTTKVPVHPLDGFEPQQRYCSINRNADVPMNIHSMCNNSRYI